MEHVHIHTTIVGENFTHSYTVSDPLYILLHFAPLRNYHVILNYICAGERPVR